MVASRLGRTPYDLRHACLSTYARCLDGEHAAKAPSPAFLLVRGPFSV